MMISRETLGVTVPALLTVNTEHDAEAVTLDGYHYSKPRYATYHCEAGSLPADIPSNIMDFADMALAKINAANGNKIPIGQRRKPI